jgi:hypothetical protein
LGVDGEVGELGDGVGFGPEADVAVEGAVGIIVDDQFLIQETAAMPAGKFRDVALVPSEPVPKPACPRTRSAAASGRTALTARSTACGGRSAPARADGGTYRSKAANRKDPIR